MAKYPNRRQNKAMKRIRKVGGPTAQTVRAYAAGRAQPRMTTGAGVLLSLFASAFITCLLLFKIVLFPSVLVALLMYSMVRPYRGIAVCDGGMLIFAVSTWSGGPKQVLAFLGYEYLYPPFAAVGPSKVDVTLGPDVITMKRAEWEYLAAGVGATAPPSQVGVQPFS